MKKTVKTSCKAGGFLKPKAKLLKSVAIRLESNRRTGKTDGLLLAISIAFIIAALFILQACSPGSRGPGKDMVLVAAGSFQMGSETDPAYFHEKPIHKVTITRDYYVSRYEVTFDEFNEFCADTGLKEPDDRGWCMGKQPVIFVSFFDAVAYCNWKSKKENLDPCYTLKEDVCTCDFSKNGCRLLTEAEWEYAARGAGKSKNFIYAGSNDPGEAAWYKETAKGKTQPVGTKAPNELGLYDMSGNVWEWCWDMYDAEYYKTAKEKDPTGPEKSTRRVIRGGSYLIDAEFARTAARGSLMPESRNFFLGFRVARTK